MWTEYLQVVAVDLSKCTVEEIVQMTVDYCSEKSISDPVEILRYYQSKIMMGRALEIKSLTQCDEKGTTVISVDRNSIMETGFNEIKHLDTSELRTTLEVDFFGEVILKNSEPFDLIFCN